MNVIDHVEAAGRHTDSNVRRPIRAGNFQVSIQASSFHYCNPRENRPSMLDYASVEVALWQGEVCQELATPRNTAFLAPFEEYWGSDDVAAYVPWEVVQQIVDAACDAGVTETEMKGEAK